MRVGASASTRYFLFDFIFACPDFIEGVK